VWLLYVKSTHKKLPPPSLTWHCRQSCNIVYQSLTHQLESRGSVVSYCASDVTSTPDGERIGSQTTDRTNRLADGSQLTAAKLSSSAAGIRDGQIPQIRYDVYHDDDDDLTCAWKLTENCQCLAHGAELKQETSYTANILVDLWFAQHAKYGVGPAHLKPCPHWRRGDYSRRFRRQSGDNRRFRRNRRL